MWSRSQSYFNTMRVVNSMTQWLIVSYFCNGLRANVASLPDHNIRHHNMCLISPRTASITLGVGDFDFKSFGSKHQFKWYIGRSLPCIKHALHKLCRIMEPNCLEFPNSKKKTYDIFSKLAESGYYTVCFEGPQSRPRFLTQSILDYSGFYMRHCVWQF